MLNRNNTLRMLIKARLEPRRGGVIEKKLLPLRIILLIDNHKSLMDKNKILYISQEITPYLPESQMAELGQKLPQGIQEKGNEVRTFMPRYGCINERRNQLHEVIRLSGMNLIIDDTDHPLVIKVATLQPSRIQVYFIDNEDFFQRHMTKDLETRLTPECNDERSIFYVRGVIETVKKLRWEPSIVHCSGWISGLAPLYIKRVYNEDPSFRASKVVFALFDDAFEGTFDARFAEKLKMDGFSEEEIKGLLGDAVDYKTLCKFAIDNSDGIVQSSSMVDAELIEYAKASGKPFLQYPGEENYVEAYNEFYKSL